MFAVVLFASTGFGQATDDRTGDGRPESVEELLADLNRILFEEYMLHHNVEPYEQATLEDFVLVVNIGLIETREEVLATAGNLDVNTVNVVHNEFRLDEDTAVLIGTLEVDGRILGTRMREALRYMSVFVRRDGEWLLMAQSLTDIIDPRTLPRD